MWFGQKDSETGPFKTLVTRKMVLSKPVRHLQTITEPELSISETVSPLITSEETPLLCSTQPQCVTSTFVFNTNTMCFFRHLYWTDTEDMGVICFRIRPESSDNMKVSDLSNHSTHVHSDQMNESIIGLFIISDKSENWGEHRNKGVGVPTQWETKN